MKIGTIKIEGTGLTAGHPPVIISAKLAAGTVCPINGLLSIDQTAGEFKAFDVANPNGSACVALETVTASKTAIKVLLHGTFDGAMAVKADGSALGVDELAVVQANSQIYFV